MERNTITFCGVFRNEEQNVRRVLDVAKELGLEIKVVVQKSEDATLSICKEYGEVFEHPAQSPEASKDFLIRQLKTEWSFWLDADEVPSLPLIEFIKNFDREKFINYDGIIVRRINYINGLHIEANTGEDWQFRILRSSASWNIEKQPYTIHIIPTIPDSRRFSLTNHPIYHHRSLEKIERTTKRWNELEPRTAKYCNDYLKEVKLHFT